MNEIKEMGDPTLQVGDTIRMLYPEKYNYGWISVKDRLPEKDNVNVLVYGKYWKYRIAQLDFYAGPQKAWYKQDGGFIGVTNSENVTHWMPLPKEPNIE